MILRAISAKKPKKKKSGCNTITYAEFDDLEFGMAGGEKLVLRNIKIFIESSRSPDGGQQMHTVNEIRKRYPGLIRDVVSLLLEHRLIPYAKRKLNLFYREK